MGGSLLGSAGLGHLHWAQLGSQCLLVKVPGWHSWRCFSYIAGRSSGRPGHLSPLQSQHPVTSMDTLLVRGSPGSHEHSEWRRIHSLVTGQLGSGLAGDGLITENGSVVHSPCPVHQLVNCKKRWPCRGCLPPTSARIKSGTAGASDLQPREGAQGGDQKWWKAALSVPQENCWDRSSNG